MNRERIIATEEIEWGGIKIRVSYEANFLNSAGDEECLSYGHLQMQSIEPERSCLPMTETGYRSHFLHDFMVADAGGPVAYARAWLDQAASSPEWRAYRAAMAQPDLFGKAPALRLISDGRC